jgi:tetratricopeptide (TPR) repeat protein
MQTHFSSQTLAELFRDLFLAERSGVLHLSRGDVEKRIYFDRGMILFAESDLEDEDLGRRLIHEGKLSAGALAEARRSVSEPKDLPQALVNRGLIGKETLSHTVRYIVERVVQSVFVWEGGSARFSQGWLLQEIFETDVVATFEILLRGIFHMTDFAPIKEAMRGVDNRLKLRTPTPVPLERLALSPTHGFLLSRVDGSTRVDQILSILPPGQEDLACRFLYGMLVLGVLSYDPPVSDGPFQVTTILRDHADLVALERLQEQAVLEAYQGLNKKNPHEILSVGSSAKRDEVERAYEDAKERFSRERFLPRVREKLRSELSLLESRLVEAYLTMSQARPHDGARVEDMTTLPADTTVESLLVRVEMDKTRSQMAIEENSRLADVYFGKAKKFVREGDYFNAIQYGKLAISYNPEDARYYFLLADCQVKNPEARWQRLAEQNYIKATQLDCWNAEYLVSLGRFYKRRGLKIRARKQFEQALQIVPAHAIAMQELESL